MSSLAARVAPGGPEPLVSSLPEWRPDEPDPGPLWSSLPEPPDEPEPLVPDDDEPLEPLPEMVEPIATAAVDGLGGAGPAAPAARERGLGVAPGAGGALRGVRAGRARGRRGHHGGRGSLPARAALAPPRRRGGGRGDARRRRGVLDLVHDRGRGDRAAGDHRDGAGLRQRRAEAGGRPAGGELGHAGGERLDALRGGEPVHERHRRDRGGRGAQRGAGAVDELADAARRQPELLGDLLLAAAVDGDGEQRLALALGQGGEAREGVPEERAALGELRRTTDALERLAQLVVVVAVDPQGVQRRVVDDPVEPRPQLAHVVAAPQGGPGRHERLLQRVLRPRPPTAAGGCGAGAACGSAPRSPRTPARGRRARAATRRSSLWVRRRVTEAGVMVLW